MTLINMSEVLLTIYRVIPPLEIFSEGGASRVHGKCISSSIFRVLLATLHYLVPVGLRFSARSRMYLYLLRQTRSIERARRLF
jgi:hypothetical protein